MQHSIKLYFLVIQVTIAMTLAVQLLHHRHRTLVEQQEVLRRKGFQKPRVFSTKANKLELTGMAPAASRPWPWRHCFNTDDNSILMYSSVSRPTVTCLHIHPSSPILVHWNNGRSAPLCQSSLRVPDSFHRAAGKLHDGKCPYKIQRHVVTTVLLAL